MVWYGPLPRRSCGQRGSRLRNRVPTVRRHALLPRAPRQSPQRRERPEVFKPAKPSPAQTKAKASLPKPLLHAPPR